MSKPQREEDQGAESQKYWKWVTYLSTGLFLLFMCAIAALLIAFAGSYWLQTDQCWEVWIGVALILLAAVGCIAIGWNLFQGVCHDGESDPDSYKQNAFEALKLCSIAITAISALFAVLVIAARGIILS